ncbi:MAG: hypothetical protein M3Z64_07770 [Verrucomicrobiota bacterium]|nr:hypothetical protein [Verrucomicrobiota bacterium]
MKRILLALALIALFVPAIPKAEAADVSIDFFYNNLSNDGSWVELGDYGYGWQPNVAVSNRNWRPYSDGYWAYTDVGWTWVSYEDFGWATYHYGRWTRLRDRGWFWIPGTEWGPAWVSWRTGGDYVGWAPLPPRSGGEVVYEGRPVNGHVDLDYDIGPLSYNFVDVRYIGEPLLRERIFEPSQNYGYVNQTVNVTNITYANSTVYNYGPDYNRLSAYSTRPIQRLSLQRDNSADFAVAAQSGTLTRVQGDRLIVAAPLTLQKPSAPIAPKTVKEKITQPNFEHGWTGSDEKTVAQMKQKMKTEDAKNVPPPDIKPKSERAAGIPAASTGAVPPSAPAANPTTAAAPAPANAAVAASPATTAAQENGKGKNKRGQSAAPAAGLTSPAPATPGGVPSPAAAVASPKHAGDPAEKGRGKGKDKRAEKAPPFARPSAAPSDAAATNPATAAPEQKAGRNKGKRGEAAPAPRPVTPPDTSIPPGQNAAAPAAPQAAAPAKKRKGQRDRAVEPTTAPAPAAPEAPPAEPGGKHNKQHGRAEPAAPPLSGAPAVEGQPGPDARPHGGKMRSAAEQGAAAPAAGHPDRGDKHPAGGRPEAQPRADKMQPAPDQGAAAPAGRPDKGDKHKKGAPESAPPAPTP